MNDEIKIWFLQWGRQYSKVIVHVISFSFLRSDKMLHFPHIYFVQI